MPTEPLLVGVENGDHLRVSAGSAGAPGWVTVVAEARAGGMGGRVEGALDPDDLAAFRGAVAALAANPKARAALVAHDGFLTVRLLGDGFGHFDVRCELRDLSAIGSRLELTLALEGRDLAALLQGLDALIAAASAATPGAPS